MLRTCTVFAPSLHRRCTPRRTSDVSGHHQGLGFLATWIAGNEWKGELHPSGEIENVCFVSTSRQPYLVNITWAPNWLCPVSAHLRARAAQGMATVRQSLFPKEVKADWNIWSKRTYRFLLHKVQGLPPKIEPLSLT